MPTPAVNEREPLPPEHQEWLRQFSEASRSQSDFLLAQRRGDKDLYERAAGVVIWLDGRFVTVCALVDECSSHSWNQMIYEAWAWETGQRVRALEQRLDPLEVRALKVCAREFYESACGEMTEAIEEARHALEGCPTLP